MKVEFLEERIAPAISSVVGSHPQPAAIVSTMSSTTFTQDVRWLNDLAKVVFNTSLSAQFVSRTALQLSRGLSPRLAVLKVLQTPSVRVATSQFAYQFLLSRTESSTAVGPASGFLQRGDLRLTLLRVAASQEYLGRARGDAQTYRAAVERDLLGGQALPAALQNRPVDTVAQRLALLRVLSTTPRFNQFWAGRLAGLALREGQFPTAALKAAGREIAGPQGFRLALSRFLSNPLSRSDVERLASPATSTANLTVGAAIDNSYTTNRESLVPDRVTDPVAYNEVSTVSGTQGVPAGSPWGGAVVLPEVTNDAIMAGGAAQPVLSLDTSFASNLQAGVTFQTWFQAKSSGALLSESLIVGGTTTEAPIIYINTMGNLVAGLFDQTALPVVPNQTVLSWPGAGLMGGETKPGYAQVGAASPIISQMTVVDNTWHHLAFVVTGTTEALYVDGLLQGVVSPTKGSSYSLLPTLANGGTVTGPAGFQIGGATFPEPVSAPYPQINYPQGFIGTIDEVATWSTALTQAQIQQSITSPISQDAGLDLGLVDYFNFNQAASNGAWPNEAPGQGSKIQGPTSGTVAAAATATIPTDPFPNSQRLPGGQAWGIQVMTPLAAPSVNLDTVTSVSYKAGLDAGDQLGISIPDAFYGQLKIDVVTDVGDTSSATIVPGSGTYVRATRTGTYNVTLTWTPQTSGGVTVNFAVVPGSLNSLVELLTSYKNTTADGVTYQWAYSDPSLPGVNPSAGNQSNNTAAASYFPLWSDSTYFPNPANTDAANWATRLAAAYANLVSHSTNLQSGFANLIGASISVPTGSTSIQADLDQAYSNAYNAQPPTPPGTGQPFPVAPTATPQDAVYEFLYNANLLRQMVYPVLTGSGSATNPTSLYGWAQLFYDTVGTQSVLATNIATTIADGQAQQIQNVNVTFPTNATPSAGQIIGEAAVWALGGALGAAFGLDEVGLPILGAVLGGAGASIAGSFIGEAGVPSNVTLTVPIGAVTTSIVNAEHLDDLAVNISSAVASQWTNLLTALQDTKFIQSIMSNYGLLKALQTISGIPLNAPALSPVEAATTILSRASWETMIPAVFQWQPTSPTDFPTGNGQTTNLKTTRIGLNGPDGPQGIAVGDFNGDGKQDMVVANYTTDDLSVLLGNGDSTFGAPITISLHGPDGPQGVVVGDFNGDGIPDLAVTDYSDDELSILLGTGDSKNPFPNAITTSLHGADGPTGIAIGDFNRDGIQDLAVANYSSDDVSVLLGTNNSLDPFPNAITVNLHGPDGPEGIAVGDLNGDGIPDLAVSDYSSDVLSILLGTGDSKDPFPTATTLGLNGAHGPEGLVAADLNGDGRLDLAVAESGDGSNEITLFKGNGNGTFAAPTALPLNSGYQPNSIVAVPVKGSEFPSLVVTYNQVEESRHFSTVYSGIGVFFSSGIGSYGSPVYYSTLVSTDGDTNTIFQGLGAGDFNGDGMPDLVTSNQITDDLTLYTGTSVGNFATFLPGGGSVEGQVNYLGQIQALQGGNAVLIGPYDDTSMITPATNSPPNYLADISLPFAPESAPLSVTSPGYFLSITPAQLDESASGYKYSQSGSIATGWNLVDANGKAIAPNTLSQLFGAPVPDKSAGPNATNGIDLTPIDAQKPYASLNGGSYYAAKPAPNAYASWADAFFNWGYGQADYSPRNLIPYFDRATSNGTLSGTLTGLSDLFPPDFTYTLTYSAQTTAPPTTGTSVSLQTSFNQVGISVDGSKVANTTGLDKVGSTFSAALLGNPIAWAGLLFQVGTPGTLNAVIGSGQTIALPAGSFKNLSFLGTAVNGAQSNQEFTVTYSDGTSKTFTQSMSDWGAPQMNNPGESTAVTMPYRDNVNGTINQGPFSLYGYQFTLDSSKTVKSITLPNNINVTLLGMTLGQ